MMPNLIDYITRVANSGDQIEISKVLSGENDISVERALQLRAAIEVAAESFTDDVAIEYPELIPAWKTDMDYAIDQRVNYEGIVYKCLQAHTSQDDWTPTAAPSLWTKVLIPDSDTIPEWEQPDSTNGYSKGDKVKYNGAVYESLIDNNVWSPDAYPAGWQVVE